MHFQIYFSYREPALESSQQATSLSYIIIYVCVGREKEYQNGRRMPTTGKSNLYKMGPRSRRVERLRASSLASHVNILV